MAIVSDDEVIGPVEFLILEFEGNNFSGEILPELGRLMESGMVRVIDMAVISKTGDGDVAILEVGELSEEVAEAIIALTGEMSGLLSEADLLDLAESQPANSTTATLLVEHLWAKDFAGAVRRAGGELVHSERLHPALVAEARRTLIEVAAELGESA
ncbi:MAG: DUF6325 family protein [Thermaurantiacus sp.]